MKKARDEAAALAAQREAYRACLLAFASGLDPAGASEIVEREACRMDDVLMQFSLLPRSAQVGVYADIGRAEPWQEARACRSLLEMQFHQGTPAIWLVSRHPTSEHLVLASHIALGQRPAEDAEQLRLLVKTCAPIAKGLHLQLLR